MTNGSWLEKYSEYFLADLVLVAALGLWLFGTSTEQIGGGPGRAALGIVAVLFAPGYAFVAVLFPARSSRAGPIQRIRRNTVSEAREITVVERLVLSVGLSLCIVPLLGLGLNYTRWGVSPPVLNGVIGATTVILAVVAVVRRHRVPPQVRFHPRLARVGLVESVVGAVRSIKPKLFRESFILFVVIGLVIAGSGIAFAVLEADRGEQFTEFYLLTEDPETGEAIAGEFPDEIGRGQPESILVGITNSEGEATNYTVVVLLQQFGDDRELLEVERLDAYTVTVDAGETVEEPHTLRPTMTGKDLRVTYLLYVGRPPQNTPPRPANAYRRVHIWVDVVPPDRSDLDSTTARTAE